MPLLSELWFRFIALILSISPAQSFPPPLPAAEEHELFRRMREQQDAAARDALIEHNLRLVAHMIRKYYASYSSPEELLSIGSIGLIKAVDTFRWEKGTRFATYAAKCVQNEILMFFRSQKKLSMEVSINDTVDVDRDGNPLTYLDIIGVEDTTAEDIEMKIYMDRVRSLVETVLTARERQIVVLRYGLAGYQPRTQREVAQHLGISRSYVSRIEKRALSRLRDAFGDNRPQLD